MSSGHYCDGCAQAYYNCSCNKIPDDGLDGYLRAVREEKANTVSVDRRFLERLIEMMEFGDINADCEFTPWRDIYKQTKAYLDPR